MKKLVFATAFGAVALFACKKEEGDNLPKITINSPESAKEYDGGDSLLLDFSVTHDDDLHMVTGILSYNGISDTVFDEHAHTTSLSVSEKIKLPVVSAHTEARFKVIAEDHNELEAEKEVEFHIHPM